MGNNPIKNLKGSKGRQFRTGEEQRKIAQSGGIASGLIRKRHATITNILNAFLGLPAPLETLKTIGADIYGEDITGGAMKQFVDIDVNAAIYGMQVAKALKGDTTAAKFIHSLKHSDISEKVFLHLFRDLYAQPKTANNPTPKADALKAMQEVCNELYSFTFEGIEDEESNFMPTPLSIARATNRTIEAITERETKELKQKEEANNGNAKTEV